MWRNVPYALAFACVFGCGSDDKPEYLGGSGAVGGSGAGGSGAGGTGAGGTGAGGSGGAGAGLPRTGSALVGAFSDDDGLIFVDEVKVSRIDWGGSIVAEWTAPRLVVSADYDGQDLVVTDASTLSVLTPELAFVREAQLPESCDRKGVLASGRRFVCGGDNSSEAPFYSYSTETGALLATTDDAGYLDGPIRRVPGQDLFFSTSVGVSPTDHFLYRVGADSQIEYLGDSPYHGDIEITTVNGFFGEPVTHVITQQGPLLRLETADCGVSPGGCLVQDGELGTLPGPDARYVAFSPQRNGQLFALVSPTRASAFTGPCYEAACILQRVDVASRTVLGSVLWSGREDQLAAYLLPTPDAEGVILIASGRSIWERYYDETLPYVASYVAVPED